MLLYAFRLETVQQSDFHWWCKGRFIFICSVFHWCSTFFWSLGIDSPPWIADTRQNSVNWIHWIRVCRSDLFLSMRWIGEFDGIFLSLRFGSFSTTHFLIVHNFSLLVFSRPASRQPNRNVFYFLSVIFLSLYLLLHPKSVGPEIARLFFISFTLLIKLLFSSHHFVLLLRLFSTKIRS